MKKVLITGASDGIGKAFAKLCLEKNIKILCLSRSQPDYDADFIQTDLSDKKSIENSVKEINEKHSDFDVLINCAGIAIRENFEDIDYDRLNNLFEVNVTGLIFLTSKLIPLIKKNEADVMNITSKAVDTVKKDLMSYASSKWAIKAISKGLRDELAEYPKSRIIDFAPDGVKTDIFNKGINISKDRSNYMGPETTAELMLNVLHLPKQMEVSELLITRKF